MDSCEEIFNKGVKAESKTKLQSATSICEIDNYFYWGHYLEKKIRLPLTTSFLKKTIKKS